ATAWGPVRSASPSTSGPPSAACCQRASFFASSTLCSTTLSLASVSGLLSVAAGAWASAGDASATRAPTSAARPARERSDERHIGRFRLRSGGVRAASRGAAAVLLVAGVAPRAVLGVAVVALHLHVHRVQHRADHVRRHFAQRQQ